ncbi:MAG TPA: hypothetical protein VNM90_31135 [Haliangium sp.]|nr:hypothetical protein [Haliangium sp.]
MLRLMFAFVVALFVSACSTSTDNTAQGKQEPSPAATAEAGKEEACEHGVGKALCTRCNPKLAPAYKAKGDWCLEHDRPESQCVICNPELAQRGVK